jgi:hypothetical protein
VCQYTTVKSMINHPSSILNRRTCATQPWLKMSSSKMSENDCIVFDLQMPDPGRCVLYTHYTFVTLGKIIQNVNILQSLHICTGSAHNGEQSRSRNHSTVCYFSITLSVVDVVAVGVGILLCCSHTVANMVANGLTNAIRHQFAMITRWSPDILRCSYKHSRSSMGSCEY